MRLIQRPPPKNNFNRKKKRQKEGRVERLQAKQKATRNSLFLQRVKGVPVQRQPQIVVIIARRRKGERERVRRSFLAERAAQRETLHCAGHRGEVGHGEGGDLVEGHIELETLLLPIMVEGKGESIILLNLGELGVLDLSDNGGILVPLLRGLVKDPSCVCLFVFVLFCCLRKGKELQT